MARPSPATPAPRPSAFTAAAVTYAGHSEEREVEPHSSETWQRDVWAMYGVIPEFRFAVNWSANVSSRAVLKVMKRDRQTNVLTDAPATHKAWSLLDVLTNGRDKQQEFIRQSILHFKVAGECSWVNREVIVQDGPHASRTARSMWEVVGTEEIHSDGTTWWLHYEGAQEIKLTKDDIVIRAWVPHPKNRRLADSAAASALEVMREIRGYDFHIRAQQNSRLTGNGITWVPDSMTIKPPAGINPALTAPEIVSQTLQQVAGLNKQNPGAAEAQLPIFVTAKAEDIATVRHMNFWSPLDEKAHEMRAGSIVRLATGLDTPKEVVTGTGDMNRWGAWQVDESAVKAHIEPDLSTLAMHITTEFIQPTLGDYDVVVIADTSTLRMRPNRSKEAIELYDRGELNGKALRRETGFDEGDAPTETEREMWIKMQMIKASWDPQTARAAAEDLGVELDIPYPDDTAPREARPTPSLIDHPVREKPKRNVIDGTAPEKDPALAASAVTVVQLEPAMSAAAATLAFRAMERAGNRLRTLSGKKPDIERENTHTAVTVFPDKVGHLLEGSFDCYDRLGLPPEVVERANGYCTMLLEHGRPFDFGEAIELIGRL